MTSSVKYYQPKNQLVTAVQLKWENWGAVCELLSDLMGVDKIRGVAVTDNNIVRELPDDEASHIGLWIPAPEAAYIAAENDYITKDQFGNIVIFKPEVFHSVYEESA